MGGVKKFKDRPDSMTDLKGYRKYYTDRGLCPRCREHRELAPGHKNCRVCLDKLKVVDAKRYRRYRAERRCTYCGQAAAGGRGRLLLSGLPAKGAGALPGQVPAAREQPIRLPGDDRAMRDLLPGAGSGKGAQKGRQPVQGMLCLPAAQVGDPVRMAGKTSTR